VTAGYIEGMDSPISLRYPNGRTHETILTTSDELKPGYEFDLYGRSWNVVGLTKPPRGRTDEPQRTLCRSRGAAPSHVK
jgi:hypothetical protein